MQEDEALVSNLQEVFHARIRFTASFRQHWVVYLQLTDNS
jgi:hypothetical protein